MSKEEEINVEEDVVEEKGEQREWAEELKVSGDELLETVKDLIHEAGIKRIVIKNRKNRVLIEIPLVIGLAGIAFLPAYSAIALIAALAAECSIQVVRAGAEPEQSEEDE